MSPAFLDTPNRYTGFPPSMQENCLLHSFCLQADGARIQAALDATFAVPSGGSVRFEAIGSKVFVSVAEIGRMYSLDPQHGGQGWMSETDVTLWIMARVAGGLGIRWVPLWLFVDNPQAMATGREVYGYPKQLGRLDFTRVDPEPRRFGVETMAIRTFGKDSPVEWLPVIRLEPTADAVGDESVWGDLLDLASHAARSLGDAVEAGVRESVGSVVSAGRATQVFLKQFSDVGDPHRACYQGIVECDCEVTQLRGVGFTASAYQATVLSYDSHPFFTQLGLSPDPQAVGRGIVVDMDFSLDSGREAWRAGG